MKLSALRERRSGIVDQMKGIVNSASEAGRELNADETKKFDELKTEERTLSGQIDRAEYVQEAERRSTVVAPTGAGSSNDYGDLCRSVSLVKVIRSQMEGRSLDGAEAEYAAEAERRSGRKAQGIFVPMAALEHRANDTTSATQIVPTDYRPNDYIDALRNALFARRLGVRVLSGLHGNVDIPKYGSGLSTGWVAEGGDVTESAMKFDNVTLTPKHVGGLTEMSRQLIQQSSPGIEQLVRQDLTAVIAQQIDSAILAGTGKNNQPQGIIGATGVQTADMPTDWAGVLGLSELLELENLTATTWLGTPGVRKTLAGTEVVPSSGSGFLLQNGVMDGKPFYSTNQMPTDTLLLGDFSQVFLGVWSELDILVNPYDSTAYRRGGVLIRAMATVDVAMRHPQGFVVATVKQDAGNGTAGE